MVFGDEVNHWWWIVGGGVLMAAELIVPGVYLLWLGLGAVLVGLVLMLVPDMGLAGQLLVFAGCMFAALALGFLIQRKSPTRRAGAPLNRELDHLIGQVFVTASAFESGRGRLRVGDTTYAAESTTDLERGVRVRVVGREGQRLRVEPLAAETDDGQPRR